MQLVKMVEALQERYQEYIFKSEIRHLSDTERGVFATEDIQPNDIILKLPIENIIQGSHIELTYRLMNLDNDYSRSLPAPPLSNFPVFWTESDLDTLDGSAMCDMIPSRKANLLAENTKKKSPGIFLYYRTLVGSRAFTIDKKTMALVPFADMLNNSLHPNTEWKLCKEWFVLKATTSIPKDTELTDEYGCKTNYENLLFYGYVLPDNTPNDVTYELFDIPKALRKNLNYDRLQNTVEFELCGSYSRGTTEIFSLVRFLCCENGTPSDCPRTLNGLKVSPISKANETAVVFTLLTAFKEIYTRKVSKLKHAEGKVAKFAGTEVNVLLHWIHVLTNAQAILACKKQKDAKKMIDTYPPDMYLNQVIRKIVNKAKNYV